MDAKALTFASGGRGTNAPRTWTHHSEGAGGEVLPRSWLSFRVATATDADFYVL